jgi:hypothetical protein
VNAEQRARFGELADELIPAGSGMPSATQAGAHELGLDAVLRARPDLGPLLEAALAAVETLPAADAVAHLRDREPDGWAVLTAVVPGAYFLRPDVNAALGYEGQRALPVDAGDPPDYERDGLLDSVKARGPVYRPTPGSPAPRGY